MEYPELVIDRSEDTTLYIPLSSSFSKASGLITATVFSMGNKILSSRVTCSSLSAPCNGLMSSSGSEKRTRKLQLKEAYIRYRQRLIQKEKVHIDCEKGAQQDCNTMMTQYHEGVQTIRYIYFLFSHYYVHITPLI